MMNFDQFDFSAFFLGEDGSFSRRIVLASAILAVFVYGVMATPGHYFYVWVPILGADVRLLGALVGGVFACLLATYNAYSNRGLLVSYVVVFLPTFGFFHATINLGHALDHSTTYAGPLTREFVSVTVLAATSSAIVAPILHVLGAGLRVRWPDVLNLQTHLLGENTAVSRRQLGLSAVLAGAIFAAITVSGELLCFSCRDTVYATGLLVGALSLYNAYANKGLLVSFGLMYIPVFSYLSTGVLYGVRRRPPTGFEEHVLGPLVGTVIVGSIIALVTYALGASLRHLSRVLETRASR